VRAGKKRDISFSIGDSATQPHGFPRVNHADNISFTFPSLLGERPNLREYSRLN
jgi:hypothetical protein